MDKADLYTHHNSEQTAGIHNFFNIYGDFIRERFGNHHVKLIDIGSGCGKVLSNVIVPRSGLNFSQVIGVDISLEMVKHSNYNYGNELQSFQFMDCEGDIPLNLRDTQFDIVISTYSLHWMKDLRKTLKNLNKLLKPGGYFCCVFLQHHFLTDVWDKLAQIYPKYMGKWRHNYCSIWSSKNQAELMSKYLKECGFRALKFDGEVNTLFDYIDEENFTDSTVAFNASLKGVPEDVKNEILEKQLNLLYEMNGINNFVLPIKHMHFIAEKVKLIE